MDERLSTIAILRVSTKPLLLIVLACATAEASPWQRHTIDDASQGADGVRLGDVNGDGLPDIATAWEEGGVVRVALHPGHARAREPWPAVTVGNVKSGEDAVFVDLDGNGQLDVVSACEGGTRSLFVHWAPDDAEELLNVEAWNTEVLPQSEKRMQFMFVLPMDVNDDGEIDLVTGAKNDGATLGWFEAPENPRDLDDWTWHELGPVGWVMSIRAIDVDADGRDDLLVSDRRGPNRGVYGMLRPSDVSAEWNRLELDGKNSEVMFLDVGTFNDGLFEIAWPARGGPVQWLRVHAWVGNMLRSARTFEMPENAGSGKAAAIGDLNGDGNTDLVVSCEGSANELGLFAFLHPADGDWRNGTWPLVDIGGPEGTKFDRIELIDLDGDGDLDVLTCEERENLGVIWYENPWR